MREREKRIVNFCNVLLHFDVENSRSAIFYVVGLPGDQNLGVTLLKVTGRRKAVVKDEYLPIAHKSTLSWLG